MELSGPINDLIFAKNDIETNISSQEVEITQSADSEETDREEIIYARLSSVEQFVSENELLFKIDKICNYIKIALKKGFFDFGGSTIVQIFKKDSIKIDEDIILKSKEGVETKVEIGMKIGEKAYTSLNRPSCS